MHSTSIGKFFCLLIIHPLLFLFQLQSVEIIAQSQGERLGYGNTILEENGEKVLMHSFFSPGSVVFDVGASRGQWSHTALCTQPQILLHAFEPVSMTFVVLQNMLDTNPRAYAYNFALSDEVGQGELFCYSSLSDADLSSFYMRESLQKQFPMPNSISINLDTIDHFCGTKSIKRIDYLKIDAEGAEWKILCGAKNMLKNHQIRIVQFEYGGTYLDAKTMLYQMLRLLAKNDYVVFRIAPKGLVYISEWDPKLENFEYSNYFAICKEDMPGYEVVKFPTP